MVGAKSPKTILIRRVTLHWVFHMLVVWQKVWDGIKTGYFQFASYSCDRLLCVSLAVPMYTSLRDMWINDFIIFIVRNFSWISYLCRSTNSNINRCMICKISFIDKSFLTNKRILETAKCTEPTKFDVLKYYRNPRFYIRCIRILLLVIVVAYIP